MRDHVSHEENRTIEADVVGHARHAAIVGEDGVGDHPVLGGGTVLPGLIIAVTVTVEEDDLVEADVLPQVTLDLLPQVTRAGGVTLVGVDRVALVGVALALGGGRAAVGGRTALVTTTPHVVMNPHVV